MKVKNSDLLQTNTPTNTITDTTQDFGSLSNTTTEQPVATAKK